MSAQTPDPVPLSQIFARQKLYQPLIVLGVALCLPATAIKPNLDARDLARDGVEAVGEVLHKRVHRSSARQSRMFRERRVLVRFQPHGSDAPQTVQKAVGRIYYDNLHVGGPVRLRYSAARPQIISIDPYRDASVRRWLNGLAVMALIGALVISGWILVRKASRIRALRHGLLREAQVSALSPTETFRGRIRLHVLEWTDSTGQKGQSLPAERRILARTEIGSTIRVYIDPKTGRGWWEAQI